MILGVVVLRVMIDRPALAAWLSPEERRWLDAELEGERREIESKGRFSLWKALADPRVFALSMIYLTSSTASYGTTFFMPQIVKGLGLSNTMTGIVSAIPFIVGMAGLVIWGWSSDKSGERRWHLISASFVGFLGLAGAGLFGNSYWALVAMSLAILGIYGSRTAFWPLPSQFLSGTAAAGGIAFINAIGNLGGYFGPFVVGWIKDQTGGFGAALGFLAACAVLSALLAIWWRHLATKSRQQRHRWRSRGFDAAHGGGLFRHVRFTAASKLAFAEPGRSGFGWLSCWAQPDSQMMSKVARIRPSGSAKRCA